ASARHTRWKKHSDRFSSIRLKPSRHLGTTPRKRVWNKNSTTPAPKASAATKGPYLCSVNSSVDLAHSLPIEIVGIVTVSSRLLLEAASGLTNELLEISSPSGAQG